MPPSKRGAALFIASAIVTLTRPVEAEEPPMEWYSPSHKGVHFGVGVAPSVYASMLGDAHYGGGAITPILNWGVAPTLDVRYGVRVALAQSDRGLIAPLGAWQSVRARFGDLPLAAGVGVSAGYLVAPGRPPNAVDNVPDDGFFAALEIVPLAFLVDRFDLELRVAPMFSEQTTLADDGSVESTFGPSFFQANLWLNYVFYEDSDE